MFGSAGQGRVAVRLRPLTDGARADLRLRRCPRRHRARRPSPGLQPDVRRGRPAGAVVGGRSTPSKLRIGGGKERMASLLTDRVRRRQPPPGRRAGQKAAAGRLAPPQDRDLQGDRRAPAGCPRAAGIARVVDAALAAGWTPGRRLDLGRGVGARRARARRRRADAGRASRLRRRRRARQEARPGDLPARARASWASQPGDAIVIEDSRNGLLAAVGAGLRCVVTSQQLHRRRGHARGRARRLQPRRSGRSRAGARQRSVAVDPGELVTLADLDRCRTEPLTEEESV